MALHFNGVDVPQTGSVVFNGQALKEYRHNGVTVWKKITDVNVLATGAYTVSGKNGGSYANASQMSANSNGGKSNVYNHAICIRVATGDHTKLYLAGTMKRAQYAMSRVRVGTMDPQLYNNLYGGEGEGPGDEYLEYHSGWSGDRWVSSISFARTITVPANSNIYISLQGTNTTDDYANWGTAEPVLTQIILQP